MRRDGYALFPGLAPPALVADARSAIDDDLARNYDPSRQSEYDHQSYCPNLRGTPPIMRLLTDAPIRELLDAAIGWTSLGYDGGQIAIRRAHNAAREYPPDPHIDGIPTSYNGLPTDDPMISNFTALVGVFLSAAAEDFAGNFTVWPGSHHVLERHFRERGPQAASEGMPAISLGTPLQLRFRPGDVVLCHYQIAHAAAVNLSPNDRYAVYFRLWLTDIDSRRWELLTNIWSGWKL